MPTTKLACPKCGGAHIAVEVKTWCDFSKGKPDRFDDEDVPYVEAIPGGQLICRDCQHQWSSRITASRRDEELLKLARDQRGREGEIEFDEGAKVSEVAEGGDNGAYVQAWVWIDFTATGLDKEAKTREPKKSAKSRG